MNRQEELRQEFEDRLFNHGLTELVGERPPPDLTSRVLKAINAPLRHHGSKTPALRGLLLAATIALIVAMWRINRPRDVDKVVAAKPPGESLDSVINDFVGDSDPRGAMSGSLLSDLFDPSKNPRHVPFEHIGGGVSGRTTARKNDNLSHGKAGEKGQLAASESVEQATIPFYDRKHYQSGHMHDYDADMNMAREMRGRGVIDSMYQVDLSRISTPDQPPILYPDPEMWQMLAERRKRYQALEGFAEPTDTEVLVALAEKTEFDFTDQPLQDVLDYFKAKHDVAIQIDKKTLEDSGIGVDLPITRQLNGISLRAALRLLLAELDLSYVVRNGVILITSKDEAANLRANGAGAEQGAGDRYSRITENPFLMTLDNPLSTFSIDVDTASYAKVRRYLLDEGTLPPPDAVRIEELLNYFDYDYAPPEGDAPFAAHVEVTACPWQLKHRLLRIGLKGREVPEEARPAANLVFLLDVSGSMEPDDKLPRVRRAMRMLVEQLRENDRVAIVVYAAQSGLVLPSTTGFEKDRILAALDSLQAGGGTNGGDGIRLAYDIAQKSFQKDGINRVILCTDGDFNVGTTSNAELERLIEERAKSGVFLTVLGFGMGNHNDELMEKLADKGNGNYGYVDSEAEARRLLVEQAGGALMTIAKDVKLQLEFNPRLVAAYRLIGYEDRLLTAQDFNDDQKDAGEIGAGHTVTALYELIPAGEPVNVPPVDELKYQRPAALTEAAGADELLTLKLKYKKPDGSESLAPIVCTVRNEGRALGGASTDTQFAAAVAGFGLLLRDSAYKGDLTYDAVLEIAAQAIGADPQGRRAEFLQLVRKARELTP